MKPNEKLRQSSSWIILNDPMYSTAAENTGKSSYTHRKTKSKNPSYIDSAKKSKRYKTK